jgi:hypothetical protein
VIALLADTHMPRGTRRLPPDCLALMTLEVEGGELRPRLVTVG